MGLHAGQGRHSRLIGSAFPLFTCRRTADSPARDGIERIQSIAARGAKIVREVMAYAGQNGLLAPELAQGISRVKSVKIDWHPRRDLVVAGAGASAGRSAPDISNLRGLRDRAILAVLLGCGLRRSEVAALTFTHVQQRDGRWYIIDPIGKHGRVRTTPMPGWVKVAMDAWTR